MTDVHIKDLRADVSVTDTNSLLSPQVLEQIVREVLKAVDEREARKGRVRNEFDVRSVIESQREDSGG